MLADYVFFVSFHYFTSAYLVYWSITFIRSRCHFNLEVHNYQLVSRICIIPWQHIFDVDYVLVTQIMYCFITKLTFSLPKNNVELSLKLNLSFLNYTTFIYTVDIKFKHNCLIKFLLISEF